MRKNEQNVNLHLQHHNLKRQKIETKVLTKGLTKGLTTIS